MMLHDILEILKADEKLSNLLQATKADSKIYMYQGKTDNCISYRYFVVSSDGIKSQTKLELNTISTNYEKAEKIMERVKQLLLTVCDAKLNDEILNVSLNGGGVLFDEQTGQHILKAYFIFVSKERMM